MTRKIQGTVAVTSADNLASQLLGGYMQLGSATRRCRHCMAHRVDMGTKVCLHNNMVKVLPCSVTRLIILTLLTNIGSFFWKLTCWCTVVYVSSCFSQGQVNTIPKYRAMLLKTQQPNFCTFKHRNHKDESRKSNCSICRHTQVNTSWIIHAYSLICASHSTILYSFEV